MASMDWFQRQCIGLEEPDVVLHLGAGNCAELAAYGCFPRSRIILVEPQAAAIGRLLAVTQDLPNVEVVHCAVAEQGGELPLNLYNFAQFSSLQPLTKLEAWLPGLVQTGSVTVDTWSIIDLVARQRIDCTGDNWLVMDAPGAEGAVFRGLEENSLRNCFSRIFLRAGREPLFEGAERAERLLERLHARGYERVGAVDESDGDMPGYHLRINPAALESARLREDLSAREKALTDKEAEVQKAKLESARLREDLSAREKALSEKEAELHKTKSDLSVAIRLQALRDADLKELQGRYGAAIDLRDQQHELLVKLRHRLGDAAAYLSQIEPRPAEASDGMPAGDSTRTLAGDEQAKTTRRQSKAKRTKRRANGR